MKKLTKQEKLMLYLLLVAVLFGLVWLVAIKKYQVEELSDFEGVPPKIESESVEIRNTVKTTVSVVAPEDVLE